MTISNATSLSLQARKPTSWRKKAYQRILERDGATCSICGTGDRYMVRKAGAACSMEGVRFSRVHITSHLELEHVTPLCEGGSNEDENLKLVCHACHKAKTSKERSTRLKRMFAEWRAAQ